MEELTQKWVDKFIPESTDDLIMNSISKGKLKRLLKSKTKFNITLHGRAGIGKTATSNVIVQELNGIEYFVPCSLIGNIDNIRTNVQKFCESVAFDERPKIVILDEADGISLEGQKALRNIISEHKDTMFIITCNYLNKVIQPLQSRCPPVSLSFALADVEPRIRHILDTEEIKYTDDTLSEFMDRVITKFLPDLRTCVAVLQDCCSSGELDPATEVALLDGIDKTCKHILKDLKSGVNSTKVREYLIQNEEEFEANYLKLSSTMFNLLCKTNISSEKLANVANIIYRIDQVIDKEIQFFVLITYLEEIITGR